MVAYYVTYDGIATGPENGIHAQKDKEFNVCFFFNFYWDVGPSLFMYTYVYVGLRSSLMSPMKCD